jgi:hypothetical protein
MQYIHDFFLCVLKVIPCARPVKEALICSSCRRRATFSVVKTLDPGLRRDDDEVINQGFPGGEFTWGGCISISAYVSHK